MRAIKIEPDGGIREVEITGKTIEQQNDCIHEYLGGYFDIVRTAALGRDALMLVDDEGLLKRLDENIPAELISGYPLLAGTALLIGTQWGPDGEEFCDCPKRFDVCVLADGVTRFRM